MMSPVLCSKCNNPIGSFPCFYCRTNAITITGMCETFHPTQPQITISRDTDTATESRNHSVPNDIEALSTDFVNRRKRNELHTYNRAMSEDNEADVKRRKEICEKADSGQDFAKFTRASTNDMAYGRYESIEIGAEIQNLEPSIVSYIIPPNIQEDNAQAIISDTGTSTSRSINSMDSILSIPGPSGFQENEDLLQFPLENFQSSNLSDVSSLWLKYHEKFTCCVCKKIIDEHFKEYRVKPYVCCVCEYGASNMYELHMHSYHHCAKTVCDICSNYYTEGDEHERYQICIVCKEPFKCQTMLNQHVEIHKEHFDTHCRGCNIEICNHFIQKQGKKIFFCCICKSEHPMFEFLKYHIDTHRPITCKLCNKQFTKMESYGHGEECNCNVCGKEFHCKNLLEDHLINHNIHFQTFCRICNEKLQPGHELNTKENPSYKCCKCPNDYATLSSLRRHLFSHTGLKLFKCDVCEKRYSTKRVLQYHLDNECIPLPHKCLICRARFHSSLSLDAHNHEKHM